MKTEDDDALLAAEFVLGVLDDLTRRQLEKRLTHDNAFARHVAYWQGAFSGIDIITPEQIPPAAVWQHIARDLAPKGDRRQRPRLPPWLGWGVAAAIAGMGIFSYWQKPPSPLQPIAILQSEKNHAQFIVSLDKSHSLIQVSAFNMTLPEAKTLQLWLINGHAPPTSLGLIVKPTGNTYRLAAGTLNRHSLLAISLEPLGGSPLSGPSGPVIFSGQVSLPDA